MKVSSGTFTLNKGLEQDSEIQKLKNLKVQKYAGPLLTQFSS